MSSLALTASPWTSNDSTKKRIPNIRRTIKKPATEPASEEADNHSSESTFEEGMEVQPIAPPNDNRSARVESLLQKMSDIHIENDGDKLAQFQPLPYPEIQQPAPPNFEKYRAPTNFSSNSIPLEKTTDYHKVYNVPISFQDKPYHDKVKTTEEKIWDRLGYIVHLLEQQQNEKTDTVMEEYILYVLLGTFVIFVVDSFSRGGKYVR
jgi:hypothetical protein